jgi:hypothetical protein
MSQSRGAPNRYSQIIEQIFFSHYQVGLQSIPFERSEIELVAAHLNIDLPKNLGDIIYSFRYRVSLPESITATAPVGQTWIIRSQGRSRYAFELVRDQPIVPNERLSITKIPDATPGLVVMYALGDEQALLCRPIGAQFMSGDLIALFEFEVADEVSILTEKHYQLVLPEEMDAGDLDLYQRRSDSDSSD